MSAEGRCKRSWVRLLLLLPLLLLSLTTAYPTTTSGPDASPTTATDVTCTRQEEFCWARGRVLSPAGDNATFDPLGSTPLPPRATCSKLLKRGPCAEGEWVVLDLDAQDASSARCARRPCPKHRVLWEGTCMSREEASLAHCGGGALHLNPTGVACCGPFRSWAAYFPAFKTCKLPVIGPPTTAFALAGRRCAQGNRGGCVKDVQGPTSAVVVKAEDA